MTENNSTTESPADIVTLLPYWLKLKDILESESILGNILQFIDTSDILTFVTTSSQVGKLLNNHGKVVFKDRFPSLDGLSESIVALQELTKLLTDPNMKFDEWSGVNLPNFHPVANLASFICHRLEASDKRSNEIYALANLIESSRSSGWHDLFKKKSLSGLVLGITDI